MPIRLAVSEIEQLHFVVAVAFPQDILVRPAVYESRRDVVEWFGRPSQTNARRKISAVPLTLHLAFADR